MDGKRRILHAEDNREVRGLVCACLFWEGYDVQQVETSDGLLANLAVDHDFDLLITDTDLNGQSVLDHIDFIIENNPNLPIIGTSGSEKSAQIWKRLVCDPHNEVVGFVAKPFSVDLFLKTVAQVILLEGGET